MEPTLEAHAVKRLRWSRYTSPLVTVPPGPGVKDRLKAAVGAILGIAITGILCGVVAGTGSAHPLLVAPMGASAVLLFALPASPLAQPWAMVGGNLVSALVGISISIAVPDPTLAAAMAVGGAIALMSMLRCLHPPGGAVALSAALSGVGHGANPYMYALLPVSLNCILLLLAAIAYHRLSGHSYPHTPPPDPLAGSAITRFDIEFALSEYGEALDVDTEDLLILFHAAERHSRRGSFGP